MDTMRAFFAITFQDSFKERFAPWFQMLKDNDVGHFIRWSALEQVHVTLYFLHALKQEDIPLLAKRIQECLSNIPSFELEFGGLEWFPTEHHSQILSLSVMPQAMLKTLADTIGKVIQSFGYPLETRPFHGHLTLGRAKTSMQSFASMTLPNLPKISVKEICLMESKPGKDRSHYNLIIANQLKG